MLNSQKSTPMSAKKCRGTVGTLLAIDLSLWWTHIPCSNNVQSLRDFAVAALLGCHDGWQTESFCWGKVWRIHRCSCQKIANRTRKKKLEELWYELFKLLFHDVFVFLFGQVQSMPIFLDARKCPLTSPCWTRQQKTYQLKYMKKHTNFSSVA